MQVLKPLLVVAAALLPVAPTIAADPAPTKLVIKPLLCVIDKAATSCAVTFDIRWKTTQPGEYCVGDSVQATPLRCWSRALAGDMTQARVFTEDFSYWLAPLSGNERLSEVKVEVLRVGSDDRRRQRRSRHVWDVL